MAQDGLSIDVAAELAAATSTPAAAPAPASAAAEEGALPPSDSDDTDLGSSFWQNPAPESDEEPSEAEETETESETESEEGLAPYKFKGYGKEFQLDPVKDRAEIEKRLSLAAGAQKVMKRTKELEKSDKEKSAKLKDWQPKVQLLEKMQKAYEESGGSVEVAYEIFSGGKSLEKEIERRVQEQLDYLNASPEKQRAMDREREDRIRKEEEERAKRSLQREREEVAKERFESQVDKAHSMAFPAFKSVVKELDIQDANERQGVAKMLWRQMWDNIRELDEGVEFTPDLFEREAKAAARLLGHSRKEQAQKEVKKIVEEKKAVAKKKAAATVSKGYKRGYDPKVFDGLSPTKIFDKMFGVG